MFCPKCKYEYRPGITKCADCGCDLVEDLSLVVEEVDEDDNYYIDEPNEVTQVNEDELRAQIESLSPEERKALEEASKNYEKMKYAYVTMRNKYEDNRSSAWTFFILGGAGVVAVLLFATGVIDFNFSAFSKYLTSTVMGALFIIFIIVGFMSAKSAKTYKIKADEEEALTESILTKFRELYTKEGIDKFCNISSEDSTYDIWQKRSAFIARAVLEENKLSDPAYLEYIAEMLYNEFFE